MPKRTTAAEVAVVAKPTRARRPAVDVRVVIVTMDSHLAGAAERAQHGLAREMPGLVLTVHAACEWGDNPAAVERCRADIARGDIVIAAMLFLEEHFTPIVDALRARRESCDAMVCAMSAAEVTKLTRMGRFDMSTEPGGPMAFLKRLRSKPEATGDAPGARATAGEKQMRMLRRLPKILRFIPGTAQDVRAYFVTLQYWLAGSEANIANMVRFLVDRYAAGPRQSLRGTIRSHDPVEYPEVGVYHPRMQDPRAVGRLAATRDALPSVATTGRRGTVGLLLMRSYLLAGNADHYDGVITAMEARGLRVVPAYATGLDGRPAIEAFFCDDGRPVIDALVSLTGFSLVGGPAYNDSAAAEEMLARLDVPYLAVTPVEFQTLDQWGGSTRGLLPVEATMMVAIPELDGATGSMVFGGRGSATQIACTGCAHACRFTNIVDQHDMHTCIERADALAARIGRLVDLRRSERANRKVAAVIFNFPPNAGATGTAAFLSVFESLFNTLVAMQAAGYRVELPASVDALRERIIGGNAARHGAMANVHARIGADDHVRREKHLKEIEAQWGPSPGKQQSDGSGIFVLGERFGNVFVGIQPAMGYEGDPMRLLFEHGSAPTHAFSAFYRWLREDFKADAVLHFGTHGALEFMPGKQNGMSAACWPDRLIGDLPNFYLYASNNPSEGTIAKRRAAATLISYLTPPVAHAGLYKELVALKETLERFRSLEPDAAAGTRRTRDDDPPAGDRVAAHVRRRVDRRRRVAGEHVERAAARTGVHADPARAARRRPRAVAGAARRAARVVRRGVDRRAAGGRRARRARRRRLVAGRARDGRRTGRRRGPRVARRTARARPAARGRPRARRHPARARRPLPASGAGWRPAAHAGRAADRPQPARLRSVPHPERVRDEGRFASGAATASTAISPTATRSPSRSRSCCGAPTT